MDHEEKQVNIVHERDLDKILAKFNLENNLSKGILKCKFSDTVITKANIYSIVPEAGTINLVCDLPECVIKFAEYMDEKNRTKLDQ